MTDISFGATLTLTLMIGESLWRNCIPDIPMMSFTTLWYIDAGIIPKYAGCVNGVQWFRDRGQWADGSYEPSPGTIIFFDWEGDGVTDHTGIVQKCENGTVYTVEGNSGDTCRTKTYPVGSSVIYGYGIPAY